jgi:hypothetical protein
VSCRVPLAGNYRYLFCNAKFNSGHKIKIEQMKKQVEADDFNAIHELDLFCANGSHGLRHWNMAFIFMTQAAELGSTI